MPCYFFTELYTRQPTKVGSRCLGVSPNIFWYLTLWVQSHIVSPSRSLSLPPSLHTHICVHIYVHVYRYMYIYLHVFVYVHIENVPQHIHIPQPSPDIGLTLQLPARTSLGGPWAQIGRLMALRGAVHATQYLLIWCIHCSQAASSSAAP